MNDTIPSLVSPGHFALQRDRRALLAIPAIGCVVTAASAAVAAGFVSFMIAVYAQFAYSNDPDLAYQRAHYRDALLTSHPVLLAACCALIVVATRMAFIRRKNPTILLLIAAGLTAWIPVFF